MTSIKPKFIHIGSKNLFTLDLNEVRIDNLDLNKIGSNNFLNWTLIKTIDNLNLNKIKLNNLFRLDLTRPKLMILTSIKLEQTIYKYWTSIIPNKIIYQYLTLVRPKFMTLISTITYQTIYSYGIRKKLRTSLSIRSIKYFINN